MTKTRTQLRNAIRQQIGDEVRISGTATGGSTTTIIDTNNLTQDDDYWNRRKVHISDTTDDLAPKDETRKVSDFVNSTNTITVEMPYTAAVASGDTYQICVFPDTVINQIITSAIAAYSKYRKYKTTGTFTTVSGTRRYSPPTGLDFTAGHSIDEIRFIDTGTMEDYSISGWQIDVHNNKIDMGTFYPDEKTWTVFWTQPHDDFSSDSDTITIPDKDEGLLLQWIRAQFWLLMSKEDFDDFGNLKPSKWTRGRVSEEYGNSRKHMKELYSTELTNWEKAMFEHSTLFSGQCYDAGLGKGEWVAPLDYRVEFAD